MRSMSATCPERTASPSALLRAGGAADGGFTLVSVLFIVVVLAGLGAAIAHISQRQHLGSAAEIESARALQAARAGLEWAAFQVLRTPAPPAAAPACFGNTSFNAAGLDRYTITVSCTRTPGSGTASDGATALVFYQLQANACNAPSKGACPSTEASPDTTYVERQLTWTVQR